MRAETVFLTEDEVTYGNFVPVSSEIEGSEGYRVNREGVVLGRHNNRVLTRRFSTGGYYSVGINGRQYRLGKLLCLTFHGSKPPGKNVCVMHLDGPRTCSAARVRWGTQREALDYSEERKRRLEARRARSVFCKEKREGGGIGLSDG